MPYGHNRQYLDLVREAEQKRISITKAQQKEIRGAYREISSDLERELRKHSESTLTYRWLKDYGTALRESSKALYDGINTTVSGGIQKTAEAVTGAERDFYSALVPDLSRRFRDVFSSIPQQAVNELMSGGIYRDFSGLSERIWDYRRKYDRDISTIINRGILAKKPAYELAKDLERYLDPSAQKPWDWSRVYPGVHRQVDYNAQRLARTSVTHAYQLSFQRATRDNPFVERYQWLSSNSARVCPLCAERDGRYYEKDALPLDHPNGMCTVVAVIEKSSEEIATELAEWASGGENPALDRWLTPKESAGGSLGQASAQNSQTDPLLSIFSRMSEFRREDGTFDLSKAKDRYASFLTSVPEKNRLYLQQSFEAVEYEAHALSGVPFGYLPRTDKIYYDTSDSAFWHSDFIGVNTHELAHRIDVMFVRSWENEGFSKAIRDAKSVIDADPQKFIDFCEQNDQDGFLSDIFDAVCESEYRFYAGHGTDYWAISGNREKETFANLYSLQAFQDEAKLAFLSANFKGIMDAFDSLGL